MGMKKQLVALAASLLMAAPAGAATLLTSGTGAQSVTGATEVNVSGTLYDVEFLDGTCGALFDGCDTISDFAFTTSTDAKTAAEALVAQVFSPLVGPVPNNIRGCNVSGIDGCQVMVPFQLLGNPFTFIDRHTAQISSSGSSTFPSKNTFLIADNTADFNNHAYARFSPTPLPVPIPAAAPLLLTALGGLALLRRRRQPRAA